MSANNISVITIKASIQHYIDTVALARSKNTAEAYFYALVAFADVLQKRNIDINTAPTSSLPEEAVGWFATALKLYSPATEQLYLVAAKGYYEFLSAEGLADINLPKVRLLIRQRARRSHPRLPQFPRESIEKVLAYVLIINELPTCSVDERLINFRDRAFIVTLADTGLRVHEACGLQRGDMDWKEGRAIIVGKGNRQAIVRFSNRSLKCIKEYLLIRSELDGATRKPLASLPVFSRHDRGAGNRIRPITTVTGRNIVSQRVIEAIGESAIGSITPHSFRHYFVTTVLLSSGNLKLAQELARHQNITVTQRYAHLSDDELDQGYWSIFNDGI
jgi:site-specific recombinase XerD